MSELSETISLLFFAQFSAQMHGHDIFTRQIDQACSINADVFLHESLFRDYSLVLELKVRKSNSYRRYHPRKEKIHLEEFDKPRPSGYFYE